MDFLSVTGSIIFSYYIIFKTKYDGHFSKKLVCVSGIGIIFSFAIFFLSSYRPNIWDFDNRNLGALRLFATLFIVSIFLGLWNRYEKLLKLITFSILIILGMNMISIKNAWIYSNDFNTHLFEEIKKTLPKNPKTNYIYVTYDRNESNDRKIFLRTDSHFIFSEPVFQTYWDAPYLRDRAGIPKNYRVEYLHYRSNDKLPAEYYLFDYKTKKMTFIKE